ADPARVLLRPKSQLPYRMNLLEAACYRVTDNPHSCPQTCIRTLYSVPSIPKEMGLVGNRTARYRPDSGGVGAR
ncbi:MAG: hypothetical protein M3248_06395, partial [Actinomycetota bacterium]|nr:hypothetical protein [Actinomycetota bacterium]